MRSVLLVDDHRVFTDALGAGLDRLPDIRCAGVAHSVAEGLALVTAVPADVVVVDLDLPDGSGMEVLDGLARLDPAPRAVVLTAHLRPDLAERAVAAGAVAFLGKDGTLQRIVEAVRHAGPAQPMVEAPRDPEPIRLTPREHDVLRLLGQGLDPAAIAAALEISLHTARDHIKSLKSKLGVHSQVATVVAAGRLGLINVGSRF